MIFNTNRSYYSAIKPKKMTDTTTTKSMEELVMEIPVEQIVQPTIPIKVAIREAGNLQRDATEDKEALIAKGLAPEKIEELAIRADFLSDKQTLWIRKYETSTNNTKEWEALEEEASKLQRELKHDFQFALRNNKEALRKLKNITKGNDSADLAQDMGDYAGFGLDYPEELGAINFDNNKLTRADELSHKLNNLVRVVDGAHRSKKHPEKQMRDRAYTYLKLLVDDIRAYGKYAFWDDEEMQKRYSSEYQRRKYQKNKEDENENI